MSFVRTLNIVKHLIVHTYGFFLYNDASESTLKWMKKLSKKSPLNSKALACGNLIICVFSVRIKRISILQCLLFAFVPDEVSWLEEHVVHFAGMVQDLQWPRLIHALAYVHNGAYHVTSFGNIK